MQPTDTQSGLLGGGSPKGDKRIKEDVDETEKGVEG